MGGGGLTRVIRSKLSKEEVWDFEKMSLGFGRD